ncbi:MAG TPA: 16S rRNA (adenine(1518)-N(6)/adenine(1519)-N(6))-dimethyltransferase RsmA [Thermoguttaceae bacterium]|nr:16S rRNA (adenine(1518)-N(6)/adenine(1519)-N(6))-dimethyltransferase RsmA [Thermoguttaceae bacterium]
MPHPANETRTISFLMKRFRAAGIDPQKRLGQNFLIDLNLHDLLIRTAQLEPRDVVLEVGTGTGSLTVAIARQAAAVVTVELDPTLSSLASEQLHSISNVEMIRGDVLKNKNRLNPAVLESIENHLAAGPDRRFKLVANLPYNIATPILTNLLALDRPPVSMTVTIQKEMAERIVAPPDTKDYGALSIWVQSQCRAEIVRIMPPSVFWPRPKVDSAIIHIELDAARREQIADRAFFHQFVRAMFFHRRKFLRSVLASAVKDRLDKPAVDEILQRLGLPGTARAETLDVSTMLRLAEAVRVQLGE